MHRPLDHPPVTVHPPRGNRLDDPQDVCTSHLVSTHKLHRCVPHKLSRHTSRTRVRGDTRGREGARNRPTASPSYHGRRGATMGKTHNLHTIVTDTGPPPMPLFACRFHLHSFPSVSFPRGPFLPTDATQSSSSAHITSRTAKTEISSAWKYRRNAEDFHSPAAKMTPTGEPAAASDVALPALNAFKVHLFASLWPNSVSMRRTALRNEELVRSKRVTPALLLRSSGATACTAQQCGDAPAQAQLRTSRLPCGLCFLLASLMWRDSKPSSHDSIQTALRRPGGNIWASRFMPTSLDSEEEYR